MFVLLTWVMDMVAGTLTEESHVVLQNMHSLVR